MAVAVVTLVLAAWIASVLRVPYHSIAGETFAATEVLSLSQPLDGGRGEILVTLVRNRPLTVWGAVRDWLDPNRDVESNSDAGASAPWDPTRHERLFADSGATAAAVVGDLLGIEPSSVGVTVDTRGVGGPSAGLAFALELVDELTVGDLTGSRLVAVTGEIDRAGGVSGVGGIRYKVAAARRAGADLMLVPVDNHAEALAAAGTMPVVAVATVADALAVLKAS